MDIAAKAAEANNAPCKPVEGLAVAFAVCGDKLDPPGAPLLLRMQQLLKDNPDAGSPFHWSR